MNKEEYMKYYIQGSDHYLLPKYVFNELFEEMVNWREENKQLKEKIDKAIEYILNHELVYEKDIIKCNKSEILEILKGDPNER